MSTKPSLRLSQLNLSPDVEDDIKELKLDIDGDGAIDGMELTKLIESLVRSNKNNKNLRQWITVLVIFSIVLTGGVFGVSIAAARLSKDTTVDPVTGMMYVKGSDSLIQTESVDMAVKEGIMYDKESDSPLQVAPVSYYEQDLDVVGMDNEELRALTAISLWEGAVEFTVRGYARSLINKQVSLFVEGGSILYDEAGLLSATGTADTALAFAGAYDVEAAAADADAGNNSTTTTEGVRRLRRKRGSNGYYNKKPRSPGVTCDMETVATQLLESEWNSGSDYKESEYLVNTALQEINYELFYQLETLVGKTDQIPECQAGGKPYYQVTCDMKKGNNASTINRICTTFERDGLNVG